MVLSTLVQIVFYSVLILLLSAFKSNALGQELTFFFLLPKNICLLIQNALPTGPHTKTEGVLSYPEVCVKLINPNNQKGMRPHLRKVTDPSKRFGKSRVPRA